MSDISIYLLIYYQNKMYNMTVLFNTHVMHGSIALRASHTVCLAHRSVHEYIIAVVTIPNKFPP